MCSQPIALRSDCLEERSFQTVREDKLQATERTVQGLFFKVLVANSSKPHLAMILQFENLFLTRVGILPHCLMAKIDNLRHLCFRNDEKAFQDLLMTDVISLSAMRQKSEKIDHLDVSAEIRQDCS